MIDHPWQLAALVALWLLYLAAMIVAATVLPLWPAFEQAFLMPA